jgi:hypothetical protein
MARKKEVVHILAIGSQSTYCGLPAKPALRQLGRRTPLSTYPLAAVPGPLHITKSLDQTYLGKDPRWGTCKNCKRALSALRKKLK